MTVPALLLLLSFGPDPASALPHSTPAEPMSSSGALSGNELLRIGEIHDHQHHFPETLTYYRLALARFREKKQSRGIATALVKIARVQERQGKLQEAYQSLQEAVPLFARTSDRVAHADALSVFGRMAARLGNREEAGSALHQAITLFERAGERRGWNEALVQLGLLQVDEGRTDEGLSSLQRARREAGERRDVEQQLAALSALGDVHWLSDRPIEARAYYDEGLRLAEKEHRMPFEAKLRLRLAQVDDADGQPSQRIALGKRALLLSQTLRDPATEAAAWSLLADLYRRTDRHSEAEDAEQRALAIYRQREILVHGAR